MRPFRITTTDYQRAIAIDASTIGSITVTVAVSATRSEELDILDNIYSAADDHPFFPFRDKGHDIDYDRNAELFENIVSENSHRIQATTHLGQDGSDQERIEAVQSAVLVNNLNTSDTLIILDGDDDKVNRFSRASSGLSGEVPPVVTCIQSELYYPASLLADLCASHLARQISHPRHCSVVVPSAPITKQKFSQYWGKAYNSMVTGSSKAGSEPIEQRRGETVPARMNCWFNGYMGGGEPVELETSTKPIVEYVKQEGYDELASRLSDI
ncbi:MAG: hypothetical protein ACI80F_002489 [Natronomonas sp.]|uniref:hypothetical protein n=1 Tax=Natronomonas sp. TaxID=2184060 RepID=UPI00398963D3